mmetsp:Transcript_1235/g.2467  ORF Transcript_1235/g.2467 Transcript_1235/m.2467 type:complete len:203 (+) Transcript_1235:308-916(+)
MALMDAVVSSTAVSCPIWNLRELPLLSICPICSSCHGLVGHHDNARHNADPLLLQRAGRLLKHAGDGTDGSAGTLCTYQYWHAAPSGVCMAGGHHPWPADNIVRRSDAPHKHSGGGGDGHAVPRNHLAAPAPFWSVQDEVELVHGSGGTVCRLSYCVGTLPRRTGVPGNPPPRGVCSSHCVGAHAVLWRRRCQLALSHSLLA